MPRAAGARGNVYEVTGTYLLERIDVLRPRRSGRPRVRLAVFAAPTKDKPVLKLTDVQVDVPSCEGWASSGPLACRWIPGAFTPSVLIQTSLITTFVNADMSNIPIDGHFAA